MIRATRTGHPCEGVVHADHLPASVNLTAAREDGWVIETIDALPDDLNLPADAARLLEAVRATDLPWTLTQRPPRTGTGTETVIDIRDIDPQGGWSNPWKDWKWDIHGALSSYITVGRALELLAGHTKKKEPAVTEVRATRAATSPVIGHYEAATVTDTDWDTGDTVATRTVYRAHLADGTPAGAPTTWGTYLTTANTYPTEAAARAAIRKAHRHLTGLGHDIQTIAAEQADRPDHTVSTTTVRDDQGHTIGAVHHRADGTHTAALLTANGLGYLPVEVCDTAAEAAAAVRAHLTGALS